MISPLYPRRIMHVSIFHFVNQCMVRCRANPIIGRPKRYYERLIVRELNEITIYSGGFNNCGDKIIAVRFIFLRILIAVHGIIASLGKIMKNINCGGTTRVLNTCGASYVYNLYFL